MAIFKFTRELELRALVHWMYSGAAAGVVSTAALLGAALWGQHSAPFAPATRVDFEAAGASASSHAEALSARACPASSVLQCPECVCECSCPSASAPLAGPQASQPEGASVAPLVTAAGAGAGIAAAGSQLGRLRGSRLAASRRVDASTQTEPQYLANSFNSVPKSSSGGSSVDSSTPVRVRHGRRA